jgi:hypothetical protein
MIKKEKLRLRVSNIYDYNASIRLDKECKLNKLKRFIKKQIKNMKNGEQQW